MLEFFYRIEIVYEKWNKNLFHLQTSLEDVGRCLGFVSVIVYMLKAADKSEYKSQKFS